MKIHSVFDSEFSEYGKVIPGYDLSEILSAAVSCRPMPAAGTDYEASISELEACKVFSEFTSNLYGGMPIEAGMCWGYNKTLNCLEYHRDSEINIAVYDMILLLARVADIKSGVLDTADAAAFLVSAGTMVEIYATTLHYAPCHCADESGFRSVVLLPRGTNYPLPSVKPLNSEDRLLTACNKWLLAHPDSDEAKSGAYIGLSGENITLN